jgi:hypothetical protein
MALHGFRWMSLGRTQSRGSTCAGLRPPPLPRPARLTIASSSVFAQRDSSRCERLTRPLPGWRHISRAPPPPRRAPSRTPRRAGPGPTAHRREARPGRRCGPLAGSRSTTTLLGLAVHLAGRVGVVVVRQRASHRPAPVRHPHTAERQEVGRRRHACELVVRLPAPLPLSARAVVGAWRVGVGQRRPDRLRVYWHAAAVGAQDPAPLPALLVERAWQAHDAPVLAAGGSPPSRWQSLGVSSSTAAGASSSRRRQ